MILQLLKNFLAPQHCCLDVTKSGETEWQRHLLSQYLDFKYKNVSV